MTSNNPKLDLAKMNAYIKIGEILPIGSPDIERKRNFGVNSHNSRKNFRKMTCNNPKLDLVNMNAYINLVKIRQGVKILSGNEISA